MLEYDAHYLKELTEEKESLAKTGKDNSHALRLLESGEFLLSFSLDRQNLNNYHRALSSEITRTSADGEGSRDRDGREQVIYFDIYRERPIRLTVRALVPTKEHPKVMRLFSPGGTISYIIYFSLILWVNCWDQRGIP